MTVGMGAFPRHRLSSAAVRQGPGPRDPSRRVLLALLVTMGAASGPRPLWAQTGAIARPPGFRAAARTPPSPRTDTLNMLPPEVHPRARYGSFGAACDSLERLLKRTLGAYADSA